MGMATYVSIRALQNAAEKIGDYMKKRITIRLPDLLALKLAEAAKTKSASLIIREALECWLTKGGQQSLTGINQLTP